MKKIVFAILVMMMAAVGAVATVSCGSDSDAEAAIAVDKKVKQRWHCKGFGLPSHIKEMVTHAQMLRATSDGFTLWHELVKETNPINVGH